MSAVAHADMILHLEENLDTDERPPEWVYILPWELEKHMAKVAAKRKEKYGSSSDDSGADYEDKSEWSRSDLIPDTWSNKR